MSWFKVDDKLHAHRKVRAAGTKALGLWVLAGSWCMDNDTDGFMPADLIKVWGCTRGDAQRLVDAGFWKVATVKGEDGWRFHDWARFQPSAAVTAAKRAKEAEAGLRGNHKRWHTDRGLTDPDCEFCYRVPDSPPDRVPESPLESGDDRVGIARDPIRPVPVPVPHISPNGEMNVGEALVPVRDDVERICDHLANRIEANGSKRPEVTAKWRTAGRLLLDADKRTEQDVHACIDWCQADEFWRGNVLSMPKLREKYDQLRLAAGRRTGASKQQQTDDLFSAAADRLAQRGGSE